MMNMTAQVFFVRDHVENVLTVPVAALKGKPDGGEARVTVVKPDGSREMREVTVGVRNRWSRRSRAGLRKAKLWWWAPAQAGPLPPRRAAMAAGATCRRRPSDCGRRIMAPLISLKSIRKTFTSGEVPVHALKDVSLDIEEGDFVAIIGQSGSGKSTLMTILGCLDRPTSGQYLLDGEDVSDFSPDELAERRRRMFGFVFQSYNLVPTASAEENVEIPAIYAGMPAEERRDRAEALLERFGLGDRLDHLPNQLSGGQQQRVSIARALMNGGQIILADEPTGALDSKSGRDVLATLRQMHAEGHTIIIITHAPELAESADRVIEIRDGQIVADRRLRPLPKARQATPQALAPSQASAAVAADVLEAMRMSMRALRANLFRTVLTLLGIVIGVASVVAMLAIGNGAQQSVLSRIAAMGSDLLIVRPNMANFRGGEGGSIVSLIPSDADAILELPNVAFAVRRCRAP